jgi:hypothetical protein
VRRYYGHTIKEMMYDTETHQHFHTRGLLPR